MTRALVLPAPPPDLVPALRRLAVTAFDLEQQIQQPGRVPLDGAVAAFAAAQTRVRAAWRGWEGREVDLNAGEDGR